MINITQKRILIFITLTYISTWVIAGGPLRNMLKEQIGGIGWSFMMVIPAGCMFITRLITEEGFEELWLFNMFRKKFFILAWIIPASACTFTASVYYTFVSDVYFDFKRMPGIILTEGEYSSIHTILSILLILIFHSFMNTFIALGEEWGWRGYLLPKLLEQFKIIPSVVLSGLLWGTWHVPMILWGLNSVYGNLYNEKSIYFVIFHYLVLCTVLSAVFTYLFIKSKSCLCSALAHATYNTFYIYIFLYVLSPKDKIDIELINGILNVTLLVIAGVCILLLKRQSKR